MPGLELIIFGLAAAFLGVSSFGESEKRQSQDKISYISVAGDLFLTHSQSVGALLGSTGVRNAKSVASEALTSLSFDEDVDQMLEHGW